MGSLTGSRFTLKVSLRYSPEPGETDFLCEFFRIVSGILWDATDGRLAIGQVDIATGSTGGADADIWIHPADTAWPNSTGARLWIPGESIDFAQDYLMFPTVLVHELGHYLFGLRDEYASSAKCVGKVSKQASLMERYGWGSYTRWTDSFGDVFQGWSTFFPAFGAKSAKFRGGQPSEFCFAGNHDANANHPQNLANGHQPCWTYIANDANHNAIPYGLALPAATGPVKLKPPLPPPPVCVEVQVVERSLLILGPREPSVGTGDEISDGASFWIDTARAREQLGVTSGAGEPTLAPVFSTVPADPEAQEAWRRSLRAQVSERANQSVKPEPEALRARLLDVARPGRVANQQVVLVASWLSTADVDAVLRTVPDLQASGTRLQVVARGNEPGLALLAQAAFVTGGSLVTAPSVEGAGGLSSGLIALAEQSRENAAPLSRIAPPTSGVLVAGKVGRARPPELRFEVEVSRGSSHVTLGAAWGPGGPTPDVVVLKPRGEPVGSRPDVHRVDGDGYRFVQVEAPAAGRWTVVVSGAGAQAGGVRLLASEVNDRVRLDATLLQAHVRVGESLHLRARIRAPLALSGATVVARVRTPDGRVEELAFWEHTGVGDDPYEAGTYTATFERTDAAGAYTIEVEATRSGGTFRSPLDAYYRARPGLPANRRSRTISVPGIQRRAVLTAVADARGRTERDPVAGYNAVNVAKTAAG